MSATSIASPVSPYQRRDIRSDSIPFKRDRDQIEKWAAGQRPTSGVLLNMVSGELMGGNEGQREKVRPGKKGFFDVKSHANITPKPTLGRGYMHNASANRVFQKVFAAGEISSPMSKDILDLLPSHANNTETTPIIAPDAGIYYSFDKQESPRSNVDLGNLVEIAERKWENERTERIIKGEYEVLDHEGKSVSVCRKGKSPKQRPKAMVEKIVNDDDFELV